MIPTFYRKFLNLSFCVIILLLNVLFWSYYTMRCACSYRYAKGSISEMIKNEILSNPATLNELMQNHDFINEVAEKSAVHVPKFDDQSSHHDDDTVAKDLYNKVRVLIWVMTQPDSHTKKAVHVKNTWGKRANKLLFMSDAPDKDLPAIGLNISHGREHLTMKTMRAFQYVYDHHFDDADWFMKADDDTYVIVENLRYMLSNYSKDSPVYFGHHFVTIVKQGYFSGGGGYVLSKEALRRFGKRKAGLCVKDGGPEDAQLGKCMEALGVKTGESSDALGRSRFHCFDAETHLFGGYPDWYYKYDKYHGRKGSGNMSDYPVTFHYVDPNHMYAMEYFTYHLRPYGIISGLQDVNPLDKSNKARTVGVQQSSQKQKTTTKPTR